jgi:hypothetical protein
MLVSVVLVVRVFGMLADGTVHESMRLVRTEIILLSLLSLACSSISRSGAGKSERRSNVAARRLKSSKSPVFVTFFDKLAVMKILVTGSSGLIGSEAVEHFDGQGHEVFGVDNNMRRESLVPRATRCGTWSG